MLPGSGVCSAARGEDIEGALRLDAIVDPTLAAVGRIVIQTHRTVAEVPRSHVVALVSVGPRTIQ